MQDDDSLLRSFVTIKPAAEKILSNGTDVDGTARCNDSKTVKCQLCEVELTYTGGTTNMLNHISVCLISFWMTILRTIVIRSLWYRVFVKENNLDDDSLLRSFVTIKPAAEKILSDGTAKYRCARTESLEYLSLNPAVPFLNRAK
jgi:hypothetical protein